MIEVQDYNSQSIKDLFKEYHYQVSVASVLNGNLQGKIFVDDPLKPRSGLLVNPEGLFIAGNPKNQEFNIHLSKYMEDTIRNGAPIRDTDDLWFYIDNPNWKNQFPHIFTSRTPFKVGRLHYTIKLPARKLSAKPPEGCQIQRADKFLDIPSLSFPDDIRDWVKDNLDDYLERGFGAVLTHKNKIISWCTADCAAIDRCEIGIITTADMRRKGFGSMTVNAALNYCHESGYTEVGWHCEEHNMGSIATAEKVGFEKKTEYYAWVCMKDPKEHIKEMKRAEKQYP
jgi:GNAT superfamily N-acetyltransferase